MQVHRFDSGGFDIVISRFGVMFFADLEGTRRAEALDALRAVLRAHAGPEGVVFASSGQVVTARASSTRAACHADRLCASVGVDEKGEYPMASIVTEPRRAPPERAVAHFAGRLAFETDCWDVHHAMTTGEADFVLADTRSVEAYAEAHVPGAVSFPHRGITAATLAAYADDTVFVVYCAGPHCNAAQKGALRLAELGWPVKEMIGGITGWLDEGFELVTGAPDGA